jgi:hypothetical protein
MTDTTTPVDRLVADVVADALDPVTARLDALTEAVSLAAHRVEQNATPVEAFRAHVTDVLHRAADQADLCSAADDAFERAGLPRREGR